MPVTLDHLDFVQSLSVSTCRPVLINFQFQLKQMSTCITKVKAVDIMVKMQLKPDFQAGWTEIVRVRAPDS